MPRVVAPPPDSDLSALLRLAIASVDYGGPRPKLLGIGFLRALAATDVLGVDDHALVQRLTEPKRTQAERRDLRTSHPLMAFSCVCCDGDVVDAPWLYCSALCGEIAKTIRYGRRVHADGRINDPEGAEALKIRMASVVGGGYPRAQRRLSADERQAVFDRDEGLCQNCGAPGNEIDHVDGPINGDINHPDNLQLLCAGCHRTKTIAGHRIATDPEHILRGLDLNHRIRVAPVQRPCDDHLTWKDLQQELMRDRRRDFCENLERLAANTRLRHE